jgi:hypothetical protein
MALDLLKETGPLAVSSANVSGMPAATTVDEAVDQLGDTVAVFLDDGPATGGVPSTMVDLTGVIPKLLRAGAIPVDELNAVSFVSTGPEPAQDAGPSEETGTFEAADDFEAAEPPENVEISDAYPMAPGTAPMAPDTAPESAADESPGTGRPSAPGGDSAADLAPGERRQSP